MENDLEATSDLVGVAGEMTMGTDPEMLVREDDLTGLQDTTASSSRTPSPWIPG